MKIDTLKIMNGFLPYYIAIHLNQELPVQPTQCFVTLRIIMKFYLHKKKSGFPLGSEKYQRTNINIPLKYFFLLSVLDIRPSWHQSYFYGQVLMASDSPKERCMQITRKDRNIQIVEKLNPIFNCLHELNEYPPLVMWQMHFCSCKSFVKIVPILNNYIHFLQHPEQKFWRSH